MEHVSSGIACPNYYQIQINCFLINYYQAVQQSNGHRTMRNGSRVDTIFINPKIYY